MGASTTVTAKTTPTPDDIRALKNLWRSKLCAAQRAIDKAREPLKTAQDAFTVLINEAKSDLGKGYTRKRMMSWVEDSTTRLRDLMKEEEERHQDRIDLSLPVFGTQQDLFGANPEKTPDAHRDAIYWEAEGYLAGRRAGDREAPEGCAPEHASSFLKGYDKGQDENGQLFIQANEAKKRLAEPAAEQAPVDLNDMEDDEELLRRTAAKVKANLEAMNGPDAGDEVDEDEFEAQPEELAAQKPRLAVVEKNAGEDASQAAA